MMLRGPLVRFAIISAWAFSFFSLWLFLRKWLAPDGCLDRGGSFDYVRWTCDLSQDHPYMSVSPFTQLEFWRLMTLVAFTIALSVLSRRNSKGLAREKQEKEEGSALR
jgi:hypothetical protein